MNKPSRRKSSNSNGSSLHNRLSVLRAERSLSRQDLAQALGINYQTVGYIERGDFNPSLELVFRISELFSLPIEAIFSRTPLTPLSEAVYSRKEQRSSEEEDAS